MELLKSMEEAIPLEMKQIEEQLKKIMEIEEADQLNNVWFYLFRNSLILNRIAKKY